MLSKLQVHTARFYTLSPCWGDEVTVIFSRRYAGKPHIYTFYTVKY